MWCDGAAVDVFLVLREMQRERERQARAQARAAAAATRASEQARRALERAQAWEEKERNRLYLEGELSRRMPPPIAGETRSRTALSLEPLRLR